MRSAGLFTALCSVLLLCSYNSWSQTTSFQRCGTWDYYQKTFAADPSFKKQFELNQKAIAASTFRVQGALPLNDTIAVVVHVIGNAALQSLVTDAVIRSQIDVLNEDYQGKNADSTRIPAAFKPLYAKTGLTFMLAQTSPDGFITNGIERRTNNINFGQYNADNAKQTSKGGLDAWDAKQYLNLWVVDFGTSRLLGISVFPGDPRPISLHGFVCDYRAFGRGASYLNTHYNRGRTTSHELGHFLNLYHIWGDDGGACTGTDFPNTPTLDDTPNQGDATYGNPDVPGTGTVVTDGCSPNAPGIMYQNFMDYTDDTAMVMFTNGQVARMTQTLSLAPDRAPLLNSTAYQPPVIYALDARMRSIVTPFEGQAFCSNAIVPKVRIRNQGTTSLTSVTVNLQLNNGTTVSTAYNLNLPFAADTLLTLSSINAANGNNTLTITVSQPNGGTDQNKTNDTLSVHFKVPPVLNLPASVTETFSSPAFPPTNWDLWNPDNDITWAYNSNYGYSQPGSAWFNDYINATNDRFDDLIMPNYKYQNIDSIFLTFRLAAAVYSDPASTYIPIDTLSVLLSKDCGNTFTTIYKKWGTALVTNGDTTQAYTPEFFPTQSQWRKDSINLGQWLGASEDRFQLRFRLSGNDENNVFLDDVTVYTKVVPPLLKEKGLLVLPTAFQNSFAVWHYIQPADLAFIHVYNTAGQLVWARNFSGNADTYIPIDLTGKASGIYIVKMGYNGTKESITQKVVKY